MIIYCWKFHDNSVADLGEWPSLWVKILKARRGEMFPASHPKLRPKGLENVSGPHL